MDWKKVFTDKTTYPDDLTITIKGEEVNLGALRTHNDSTQGETLRAITERETALTEREGRAATAAQNLANIMENVAQATGLSFEQLVKGDTAAARAAADRIRTAAADQGITVRDGKIDWANDPIYAPINERFKPVEERLNGTIEAVRASIGVYQNDRGRIAYILRRQENPDQTKDIKFDDAVKRAVTQGYKDEVGFPDVGRAMDDLMQPGIQKNREADLVAKAREEGAAEARREMMGASGIPSGSGAAGLEFQAAPDASKRPATIAEQLTKAMNDPSLFTSGSVN